MTAWEPPSCLCGHDVGKHEHYSASTHCITCPCNVFRRSTWFSRRRHARAARRAAATLEADLLDLDQNVDPRRVRQQIEMHRRAMEKEDRRGTEGCE